MEQRRHIWGNPFRRTCQHHQQKILTLLEDVMVKKTTTAEMMARDSCDQKEIQAIRLHSHRQSWRVEKVVHAPHVM